MLFRLFQHSPITKNPLHNYELETAHLNMNMNHQISHSHDIFLRFSRNAPTAPDTVYSMIKGHAAMDQKILGSSPCWGNSKMPAIAKALDILSLHCRMPEFVVKDAALQFQ